MLADNKEMELLPTLLSVGHDNYPGLIESVFVVNAGWTQRNMWKIIKRVLPRSALEKVAFIDSREDLKEKFAEENLPKGWSKVGSCTDDSIRRYGCLDIRRR